MSGSVIPWIGLLAFLSPLATAAGEQIAIQIGNQDLISYQAKPLSSPKGGDKFKGSNFFHPLKTPSGFVVTQSQPDDHLHHFGLWWPWKFIEANGRNINCWELQNGDGLIQAAGSTPIENGFVARSEYIDRKASGGPVTLLHETTTVEASNIVDQPAHGYFLDLEITHRTAEDQPITISTYRYSGFSLRAAASWNKHNSTILTSEGMDRDAANFTHARWVRVQGATESGSTAGVLLMSHADNHAHPEKLRTWDQQQQGAVFINFNPVMDRPWVLEPGSDNSRNYRLFVYDGEVSATEAEALWESYTGSDR